MTTENHNTDTISYNFNGVGEYPTITFNGELLTQNQAPYVSGTFDDAGMVFRASANNAEGGMYELVWNFYDCEGEIYRDDYSNLPWEDVAYLTVTKL